MSEPMHTPSVPVYICGGAQGGVVALSQHALQYNHRQMGVALMV